MKQNEPAKTIEELEKEIEELESELEDMFHSPAYHHPQEFSDLKEHITSKVWAVKARKAMDTLDNQSDHSFGVSRKKTKFDGKTQGE